MKSKGLSSLKYVKGNEELLGQEADCPLIRIRKLLHIYFLKNDWDPQLESLFIVPQTEESIDIPSVAIPKETQTDEKINNDTKNNPPTVCQVTVLDQVNQFLKNKKQPTFVLLGDSGQGKSTFLRYLAYKFLIDPPKSIPWIPLYIPLSRIQSHQRKQALLHDYLNRLVKLNQDHQRYLDSQRLVLLVDGLDEITDEQRCKLLWGNRDTWHKPLVSGQWKLILSCRPEVLTKESHWKTWFSINKIPPVCVTLSLFNEQHIVQYINQYLKHVHVSSSQTIPRRQHESKLVKYIINSIPSSANWLTTQYLVPAVHSFTRCFCQKEYFAKYYIMIENTLAKVTYYFSSPLSSSVSLQVACLKNTTNHLAKQKVDISNSFVWDANHYLKTLKRIPGLWSLATNPFVLSMLVKTLPQIVVRLQGKLKSQSSEVLEHTRAEVYEALIDAWFARQARRIRNQCEALEDIDLVPYLWNYTSQLARYQFYQNQGRLKVEITRKVTENPQLLQPSHALPKRFRKDYIERYEKEKTLLTQLAHLRQLRSGCLLKSSDDTFHFLHKSLIEFFAARDLFNHLTQIETYQSTFQCDDEKDREENDKEEAMIPLSKSKDFTKTLDFFAHHRLVDEIQVIHFLADYAERSRAFIRILEMFIEYSKNSQTGEHYSIACANSLTILNRVDSYSMYGKNYENIKANGPDLSHALLFGTNFKQAKLPNANFTQTCLNYANFEKTELDGIFLGETPDFEIGKRSDGRLSNCGQWAYFKALNSKVIDIWSVLDRKCVRRVDLIKTFKIKTRSSKSKLDGYDQPAILYNVAGDFLAIARLNQLYLSKISNPKLCVTINVKNIGRLLGITLSRDSNWLAMQGDKYVRVHKLSTYREKPKIILKASLKLSNGTLSQTFSSQANYLAIKQSSSILLWHFLSTTDCMYPKEIPYGGQREASNVFGEHWIVIGLGKTKEIELWKWSNIKVPTFFTTLQIHRPSSSIIPKKDDLQCSRDFALSVHEDWLACSVHYGSILLWRLVKNQKPRLVRIIKVNQDFSKKNYLAFYPQNSLTLLENVSIDIMHGNIESKVHTYQLPIITTTAFNRIDLPILQQDYISINNSLSPYGKWFITSYHHGDYGSALSLYRCLNNKYPRYVLKLKKFNDKDNLPKINFSPKEDILAIANKNHIDLWQLSDIKPTVCFSKLVIKCPEYYDPLYIVFSYDGHWLFSQGNNTSEIQCWKLNDYKTPALTTTLSNHGKGPLFTLPNQPILFKGDITPSSDKAYWNLGIHYWHLSSDNTTLPCYRGYELFCKLRSSEFKEQDINPFIGLTSSCHWLVVMDAIEQTEKRYSLFFINLYDKKKCRKVVFPYYDKNIISLSFFVKALSVLFSKNLQNFIQIDISPLGDSFVIEAGNKILFYTVPNKPIKKDKTHQSIPIFSATLTHSLTLFKSSIIYLAWQKDTLKIGFSNGAYVKLTGVEPPFTRCRIATLSLPVSGKNAHQLLAQQLNIKEAKGLTKTDINLLRYKGAIGQPSQYASARVRRSSTADKVPALTYPEAVFEVDDPLPSLLEPKLKLDYEIWAVHLARKIKPQKKKALRANTSNSSIFDNSYHVFILLEGVNALAKPFWLRYELITNANDIPKGYAKIIRYDKTSKKQYTSDKTDLESRRKLYESFTKGHRLACLSWSISRKEGLQLISTIERDMKQEKTDKPKLLSYSIGGSATLFGSSIGKEKKRNCFEWGRDKLLELDHPTIQKDLEPKQLDLIATNPKWYIPETPKTDDKSTQINSESSNCLVM